MRRLTIAFKGSLNAPYLHLPTQKLTKKFIDRSKHSAISEKSQTAPNNHDN